MAQVSVDRGIRINAVAPGPVWTPLIPATMDAETVSDFGGQVPMGRAAHQGHVKIALCCRLVAESNW